MFVESVRGLRTMIRMAHWEVCEQENAEKGISVLRFPSFFRVDHCNLMMTIKTHVRLDVCKGCR